MKFALKDIQEFMKNKNICVLGNARSILKKEKDINKYDIICRMNRGYPKGKEKYIGSRTDILFLSTKIPGKQIIKEFNPKFVVWMTDKNKTKLITEWVFDNAIQNPLEELFELRKLLPKRPSTGCMSIYFLLKQIAFKKLTILGFDFFRTGTWYNELSVAKWHCFEAEEKLILGLKKDKPNVELI